MSMLINSFQFGRLWTPANITTALWLKANDSSTITLNGSTVSQWRDKSGNNRHASQATAASQPTYAATGFNGKPTIQFDGINDQLNLVQFAQVSNQNIFAVVDTTSIGAGYRQFLARTSGTVNNLAIYFGGDDTGNGISYRPMIYWNSGARASWGAAVRSKAIIRWSFSAGATALTQVNGQTPVTQSFAASELTSWASICLSVAQQADIDLSELIITPSTPTAADLDNLLGYLAWDWDLAGSLPAGHPYKSAPPTIP